VQADGREVMTVEGLERDGKLDPIQEGFHQEHGLQCGYCTPGMMMTSYALLKRTRTRPRKTSARRSPETCAAAPATSTSSRACSTPRPPRRGEVGGRHGPTTRNEPRSRRNGPFRQAQGRRTPHPRQGQLRR
jgi:hypothetical protein